MCLLHAVAEWLVLVFAFIFMAEFSYTWQVSRLCGTSPGWLIVLAQYGSQWLVVVVDLTLCVRCEVAGGFVSLHVAEQIGRLLVVSFS